MQVISLPCPFSVRHNRLPRWTQRLTKALIAPSGPRATMTATSPTVVATQSPGSGISAANRDILHGHGLRLLFRGHHMARLCATAASGVQTQGNESMLTR